MKKIIVGIALMISGMGLHIAVLQICSYYLQYLTQHNVQHSKLFEAAEELHMIGYLWASAVIFVMGLLLCLIGLPDKEVKN